MNRSEKLPAPGGLALDSIRGEQRGLAMPVFDCHGLEEKIILLNLSGIMCFPAESDSIKRRNWILQQLLNIAAESYQELLPESAGRESELNRFIGVWLAEANHELGGWVAFRNALVGPGQKNSPVERINKRTALGKIAGQVLLLAAENHWGIHRACEHLSSREFIETATRCKLKYRHGGEQSIHKNIWPEFKQAAHLWAAFVQASLASKKTSGSGRWWTNKAGRFLLPLEEYPEGGVSRFLAVASQYRAVATSLMPQRGPREPILDPTMTWEVLAPSSPE